MWISINRKFRVLIDPFSSHSIRGVRLEGAADLLVKTDETAAIIADKTDFGSATYLINIFRGKFRVTPGAHRN
ncbi:MAG: transcriptional regulator GlxA family with amidase domain [Paraglaciecola sp.]|jgi:transcriptional regulator GlxA family with amidase domain